MEMPQGYNTIRASSRNVSGNQFSSDTAVDRPESDNDQTRSKTPTKMTPLEKWGIPGLLEKIRSNNPDESAMVIGHDLTTLGLDLNSSEYAIHYPFTPVVSNEINL